MGGPYGRLVDRLLIGVTVGDTGPVAATPGRARGMTMVHLNDADLVEDLIELLRGSDCVVDRVAPRSIRIRSGWPVRDDASSYELDGYLRVFEAMHPGARATRDC